MLNAFINIEIRNCDLDQGRYSLRAAEMTSETVMQTKADISRLRAAEMRFLRDVGGRTRRGRIRNKRTEKIERYVL